MIYSLIAFGVNNFQKVNMTDVFIGNWTGKVHKLSSDGKILEIGQNFTMKISPKEMIIKSQEKLALNGLLWSDKYEKQFVINYPKKCENEISSCNVQVKFDDKEIAKAVNFEIKLDGNIAAIGTWEDIQYSAIFLNSFDVEITTIDQQHNVLIYRMSKGKPPRSQLLKYLFIFVFVLMSQMFIKSISRH